MSGLKALVGETVRAVLVSADHRVLAFETDTRTLAFDAVGDCCSESWFAEIMGADVLVGRTVRRVEEVVMPEVEQEYETIASYGLKLYTDTDCIDVVFRNASNGYYGGYLEPRLEPLPEMQPITAHDWRGFRVENGEPLGS